LLAPVTLVVEGYLDELVCRRLLAHTGLEAGAVHGRRGKNYIDQRMKAWRAAADRSPFDPWLVLRDLDQDAACAGAFISERRWIQPQYGVLRLAVPSVEAWLLADLPGIAATLQVSEGQIPTQPERLFDAKQAMLELGSRSRDRAIRDDLLPRPGGGRKVGPGYDRQLGAFAARRWSIATACKSAPSLARAARALESLRDRLLSSGREAAGTP